MKKFIYLVFFIISCFVIKKEVYATHAAGMDISYECMSRGTFSDSYKITVKFYRDCSGVGAPSSVSLEFTSSCNSNYTNLNQIGTPIVLNAQCSNLCNGGAVIGIEEYTYEGIITLDHCSDWVLSACVYARNNAITTIDNPGAQDLCVQATLDNTLFCNNSPTFSQYPTPFICANYLFCYNNGAIEIDGDSLTYELITPLNSTTGGTVTYIGGYSANNPVGGNTTFDSNTGNFCVTPPNLLTSVLAIRVNEYRNGILIGSIIRDIQINVLSCSNSYISLSGMNDSSTVDISDTNTYISRLNCPNAYDSIAFEIKTLNAFTSNNVNMTTNMNIPGASFNIINNNSSYPVGQFVWVPTLSDTTNSPYFFTVNIQNDDCPVPSNFSFQYKVVLGSSSISVDTILIEPTCYGNNDGQIIANVIGNSPPFYYQWFDGSSNNNVNNLYSGTYNLRVTDSLGCGVFLNNIILDQPDEITFTNSTLDVGCYGDSSGSIDLSVFGGTSPYTYQWSNNKTVEDITNLTIGTYSVTVTDSNMCTHTDSFIVSQPLPLSGIINSNDVSCNGDNDGDITVIVTGGTSNYFLDVGGYQYQLINNITSYTTPKIFTAGSYLVTISDANGCLFNDSILIYQPDSITVNEVNTDVSCFGGNDGLSNLSISGGSPPYIEDWGNNNPQSLSSGLYFYSVTDSKGCIYNDFTIINDPPPIQSLEIKDNVLCYGDNSGSVSLVLSGGTGVLLEDWFGQNPNQLYAGSYNYQVIDDNGCIYNDSVNISEPDELIVFENTYNVICYGDNSGSAILNSAGGTGTVTYNWNGFDPTQLYAGVFNYIASDANGCTYEDSVLIIQPDSLIIVPTVNNISCIDFNDGEILLSVQNNTGTPPFTFEWNGPSSFYSTNQNIYNLIEGNYQLEITDYNGCKDEYYFDIVEPIGISIQIDVSDYNGTNISCKNYSDGKIDLSISGPGSPYQYQWSNGSTSSSLDNLQSGIYQCTVTDNFGCSYDTTITLNEPQEELSISANITTDFNGYSLKCNGDSDAQIITSSSGGTPSYQYLWSNGEVSSAINNLYAGAYTVFLYDINGCFAFDSVNITQPQKLKIDLATENDTCNRSIGKIEFFSSGGITPYTYLLDSDTVDYSIFSLLSASLYNINIIDKNECSVDTIVKINNAVEKPNAQFSVNPEYNSFYDQLDNPFRFADISTTFNDKISQRIWNIDKTVFYDSIFYYSFQDTGLFNVKLTVISEKNCIDTISKNILVDEFDFYIPNSFTPNEDDNYNNEFFIKGYGISEFKLKIYNRWGELVFQTNNMNNGWDGTHFNRGSICPPGFYVYVVNVFSNSGEEKSETGQLRLIR